MAVFTAGVVGADKDVVVLCCTARPSCEGPENCSGWAWLLACLPCSGRQMTLCMLDLPLADVEQQNNIVQAALIQLMHCELIAMLWPSSVAFKQRCFGSGLQLARL